MGCVHNAAEPTPITRIIVPIEFHDVTCKGVMKWYQAPELVIERGNGIIIDSLREGLILWSNGKLEFNGIEWRVANDNEVGIIYVRVDKLNGYAGKGEALSTPDGRIIRGNIIIDPLYIGERLIIMHEMGHAFGLCDVNNLSLMNDKQRTEPTDFDRLLASLIYN